MGLKALPVDAGHLILRIDKILKLLKGLDHIRFCDVRAEGDRLQQLLQDLDVQLVKRALLCLDLSF